MSNSDFTSPKEGIRRLVDLEKLRARRRTLKRLLIGSGAISAAGAIHAQQNTAAKSISPVVGLLLEDSCDVPENPDSSTPASGSTPPAEFTLNASNYTGTASRQFLVSNDAAGCDIIVTATASVCMEVVSSNTSEAIVDIDLIVILEGLSEINAANADPAVDYYIRNGDAQGLRQTSIKINQENAYSASRGPVASITKTCGFMPSGYPFTLRIENNQPIMSLLEVSRANPGFTVPPMSIMLSGGDCAHPTRFATSCDVSVNGGHDDTGIVTLTTPPPDGGPIL